MTVNLFLYHYNSIFLYILKLLGLYKFRIILSLSELIFYFYVSLVILFFFVHYFC